MSLYTTAYKIWSQKGLVLATSYMFILFLVSRNLHQRKFRLMNLNLIGIISMSLLKGELSLNKRKYAVNQNGIKNIAY